MIPFQGAELYGPDQNKIACGEWPRLWGKLRCVEPPSVVRLNTSAPQGGPQPRPWPGDGKGFLTVPWELLLNMSIRLSRSEHGIKVSHILSNSSSIQAQSVVANRIGVETTCSEPRRKVRRRGTSFYDLLRKIAVYCHAWKGAVLTATGFPLPDGN